MNQYTYYQRNKRLWVSLPDAWDFFKFSKYEMAALLPQKSGAD